MRSFGIVAILLSFVLLPATACGPSGDGEVISCSCGAGEIGGDGTHYWREVFDVELCRKSDDTATDPAADAEAECKALADALDTTTANHDCKCNCVHLVEQCRTVAK